MFPYEEKKFWRPTTRKPIQGTAGEAFDHKSAGKISWAVEYEYEQLQDL